MVGPRGPGLRSARVLGRELAARRCPTAAHRETRAHANGDSGAHRDEFREAIA